MLGSLYTRDPMLLPPSGRIYRLGVQVSAIELSSDVVGREPEEAF